MSESVSADKVFNESVVGEVITSTSTVSAEIFWSLEAITPTPVVLYELKAEALTLWSLYTQEKYKSTGNSSTNTKIMRVFDIPQDVSCLVGAESSYSYWIPSRFQRWRLDCRTDDFEDFTAFVVNGTAAQGLTGGIYYDIVNPILVHGMGEWPEICYKTVANLSATATPTASYEITGTQTPLQPNSP